MKVKKIALRAVAVLLVLAVLFSFGACGKKEKMNDDEYIEAIKSMSILTIHMSSHCLRQLSTSSLWTILLLPCLKEKQLKRQFASVMTATV